MFCTLLCCQDLIHFSKHCLVLVAGFMDIFYIPNGFNIVNLKYLVCVLLFSWDELKLCGVSHIDRDIALRDLVITVSLAPKNLTSPTLDAYSVDWALS